MRIKQIKTVGLMAVAALGASLLGAGSAARADILPAVGSPTVTASGSGTFLFGYDILVTSTQQVATGDFFTLYDFAGFVAVDSLPAGFVFNVENVSAPVVSSEGTIIPIDDAAVENVRFTYVGEPTIVGGPTSLGIFTIESTLGGFGPSTAFVGAGTDQVTGFQNANITNVITPGASVTVIPEPGEWAFAGFAGMSVLGLVARARRRKMSGVTVA